MPMTRDARGAERAMKKSTFRGSGTVGFPGRADLTAFMRVALVRPAVVELKAPDLVVKAWLVVADQTGAVRPLTGRISGQGREHGRHGP